jgi:acyl carrier protein
MADFRAELRTYLLNEIIRDPSYPLDDDEALLSSGLVDSFSLVDLALWVEGKTGFRIEDNRLNADTFDTFNALIAFIEANQ